MNKTEAMREVPKDWPLIITGQYLVISDELVVSKKSDRKSPLDIANIYMYYLAFSVSIFLFILKNRNFATFLVSGVL